MKNDCSSKTVYFLGAGFSKAIADLPTISEFLKIEDFSKNTSVSKFIDTFFKNSNFTIEDILTYIEIGLSDLGEKMGTPLKLFEETKEELDVYLDKRLSADFRDKRKENQEFNRKYETYVEKLRRIFKNSLAILTLNYDLLIDGILKFSAMSAMISKMEDLLRLSVAKTSNKELIKEFSQNIFLKLHGSLNWMCCSDYKFPFVVESLPLQQKLDAISPAKAPKCEVCGRRLSRLIIPPSRYKFDKFSPFIFRIWLLAKEILIKANKIIIIGISFAPSDYYLRWLFKSAIAERENNLPEIEVVNKDSCVCDKVEHIIGLKPDFEGDFSEYIEKIKLGEV